MPFVISLTTKSGRRYCSKMCIMKCMKNVTFCLRFSKHLAALYVKLTTTTLTTATITTLTVTTTAIYSAKWQKIGSKKTSRSKPTLHLVSLLLVRLMDQYCFACGRLSSVTLRAGGRAGHRARGRSAASVPCAWAVGRPTLHDGPVRLRPVMATPCWSS